VLPSYISYAGTKSQKKTMQIFGASRGFVESAKHALEEMTFTPNDKLFKSLELKAANQVASCDYEYSTAWGKQVRNRINIQLVKATNCYQ